MRHVRTFIIHLLLWTLAGTLGRACFMAVHHGIIGADGMYDLAQALVHGIRLDIATGAYSTAAAALLLMAGVWHRGKLTCALWRTYEAATAMTVSLAAVANTGLYAYWGFPLDTTPVLYIRTSPTDAVASLTFGETALAFSVWVVCSALLYIVAEKAMKPSVLFSGNYPLRHRIGTSAALIVLTASLILPIRGGTDTGTNHVGSVYFSTNMRLNHAAVNPVFSFIESALNQKEIATRYRFMDAAAADSIFRSVTYTSLRNDSAVFLRDTSMHPDIVLVILESFSKYIMSESGNEKNVTPHLDRLAQEGLYFCNFYANGTRTDKALVSILSGLPTQPTMSIMSMPHKSAHLPSLAATLASHGYKTTFYYGGDLSYSNMNSYFMGTGFQKTVSDSDFPRKQQTGKWGVPDEFLFGRLLDDVMGENDKKTPHFRTIMTGSSHEPFDVPYQSAHKEKELNAFAYADSCLGHFISSLKASPVWDNTLVAIVPDHLGAWPPQIDNYALWRYQIPFIITGGALATKGKIWTIGVQTDIPATLLGILGMEHKDFTFSRDVLDKDAPHFAFFALDDGMGVATDSCHVIYDNTASRAVLEEGDAGEALTLAKAYLQKLYDYIDAL